MASTLAPSPDSLRRAKKWMYVEKVVWVLAWPSWREISARSAPVAIEHPEVILPARVHNPDYSRAPIPRQMFVPEVY